MMHIPGNDQRLDIHQVPVTMDDGMMTMMISPAYPTYLHTWTVIPRFLKAGTNSSLSGRSHRLYM